MMSVDRLREEWRERTRVRAFEPVMTLNGDGLVLGAGTVLARRRNGADWPELAADRAEERILALLGVAYGKAVDPRVLDNIRRASATWRDGDTVLALIHLAHAALPPLADDGAAYRLFAADKLLASGVAARDLLKACDIDTAPLNLLKAGFNPDEPRVPAGNPAGGQWTDRDDASTVPNDNNRERPTVRPEPRQRAGRHGRLRVPNPADANGPAATPARYTVEKEPPPDAHVVVPPDGIPIVDPKSGKPLIASARADFREVYAAGRAISSLPIAEQYRRARAAIAQEGTYDFQRDVLRQKLYPPYTPAASYAVGVYMAGAGYSLIETLSIAKLYAFENSSNYSAQDQLHWIAHGWSDAKAGRWR